MKNTENDLYFNHLYKEEISHHLMPSSTGNNLQELVCKIPVKSENQNKYIGDNQILKIVTRVGSEDQAKEFTKLTSSIGNQLIAPLLGKCFHLKEDIWLYKFCIGESVDQYHVEANGTISEEFSLGMSDLAKDTNQAMIEQLIEEDPESETFDMLLNPDIPYLTIDKESGIILRFYNVPIDQQMMNRKSDIIGIPIKKGDQYVLERRNVVECVNDNTVIIDQPFSHHQNLSDYIFDFKNIIVEGGKDSDHLTRQVRHQHIKSFGLEIINQKLVFCKKCRFTLNYEPGDALVYEYLSKTYTAKIIRVLEDNLMEIENQEYLSEQPIIVTLDYFVMKKLAGLQIDWKSLSTNNGSLEIKIEGSRLISKEQSLIGKLNIGDMIFFEVFAEKDPKQQIKDRKTSGPIFKITEIIDNGFSAGIELLQGSNIQIHQLSSEFTSKVLLGTPNNEGISHTKLQSLSSGYLLSNIRFDQNRKIDQQYFKTQHILNQQGVFVFKMQQNQRIQDKKLRLVMQNLNINSDSTSTDDHNPIVEFVYNSKYGLLINGQQMNKGFDNITHLYFIMDTNDTLYFADNATNFASIYHSIVIPGLSKMRLQMLFDSKYSDSIDISELRVIQRLPLKLQKQLSFFTQVAPNTQTAYHVDHYTNGTMCAVNNKPRQVTIFYYCDYFGNNEAQINELSEPDWCTYHVKILTKYMCGKWASNIKGAVEEIGRIQNKTKIKCQTRQLNNDDNYHDSVYSSKNNMDQGVAEDQKIKQKADL
ncbi:UNKNOWN [Stylonychia lemnae]|uniref:MRH domain-containing protein n=1 Tax=Stylonychia lemnae TaxID=5949 RepID=A0A078BBA4_STYLE|nr:UNKNOWN [Stylonychia lemnae]|eukprot:CDW91840.1 UNKNOWN [Stylonychia lemnae]